MVPKLSTSPMSFPKTAIHLACYVEYNDFSPPTNNALSLLKHTYSLHNYNNENFNYNAICKNPVKVPVKFRLVNDSTYLQYLAVGLKRDKQDSYLSYLAAKGSYLTNSTIQNIQKNACSPYDISNGYQRLYITSQKQLHQKNCTLFLNSVPDTTGRLDIKTTKKNQSKKSNPRKQKRIN
jgi:hypothetical protein